MELLLGRHELVLLHSRLLEKTIILLQMVSFFLSQNKIFNLILAKIRI